jgi:hypothetical protein
MYHPVSQYHEMDGMNPVKIKNIFFQSDQTIRMENERVENDKVYRADSW